MSKPRRQSIELPGLKHGRTPIPMAARVGNMIFTSGIPGRDARTGQLGDGPAEQVRLAFENLAVLLQQAGAGLDDVGSVTVLVADEAFRDSVNAHWVACFPDPASRPARHTSVQALRGGMLIQLQAIASISQEDA
ncbi:MAG: RidA family protein [Burkholderiaceae bacterium]